MAAAASSSSSSSTSTAVKHDVFLSFTGQDTRAKFMSHLLKELTRKSIETYIDDRLSKGDEISPALIKAIEGSRISVIIFSENYAFSSWCLDEVVCILKCKKQHGQIVVPVFYEIEPSHVRKQQKSYEAAFAKHEERFKDRIVDEWRAALTEVANIAGWDSRNYRTESEFIEAIVKDILVKLNGMSSSDDEFRDLVGIDKRIEKMEQLLCLDDSTTVRVIGIWGMGGLGKTTLARVIVKRFSSKFQGCCFLENVREESGKCNGLESLKRKLFSESLEEKDLNDITSFSKERLRRKKVLIVLDDVDDPEQLDVLVADHDRFGFGSRIVITTRGARVLRNRADEIYELEGLDFDNSLQLFNLNAFERKSPTANNERVVNQANGNPLALKVLGSFLRSRREEKWEIELEKLKEVPNQKIHNILRISFDSLDIREQDIFLDILCFFGDKLPACRKLVERRLGAHRKFVDIGIDSLIDNSLITHVKGNDTLAIHDLLKEMGWEIERQRIKESGKHSRLCQEEQLYHVYKNKTGTPTAVEGISCFIGWERDWGPTMFEGMDRLWLLDMSWYGLRLHQGLQCLPDSLKCLIWHGWFWKSLPSKFMPHNLVELIMPYSLLEKLWSGVQILGNLKYVNLSFSSNLTEISALSQAPNLVSVVLIRCDKLRQVPPLRFQICNNLTYLDPSSNRCNDIGCRTLGCLLLGCCYYLEVVEKISGNLKELNLCSTSITELPSSILSLDNLEYLNLSCCYNLKSLPSDIQKLKSLKRLDLSGCPSIDKLPALPTNLIEIDLSGTSIELVPSIEHLSSLEKLSMSGCRRLKSLPIGISKLKSLKRLELGFYKHFAILATTLMNLETLRLQGARIQVELLSRIPDGICGLASLEKLRLDGSNIKGIPVGIKNLSKLIELWIPCCKRLKSLPELPSSLELLDASGCISLEMISNSRDALIQGLRSGNHVMSRRRFLYVDCFMLDKNSRHDIVSEFQCRAVYTGIESLLPYNVIKKSDCIPSVGICCPGNEIPMWFTYRSKSSSINVKLSSDWLNANFLGFALCAVVADNQDFVFKLSCEGNFKTIDGKSCTLRWDFHHDTEYKPSILSNMFMWYMHGNYHDYLDAMEVSFRFSDEAEVEVEGEESKVTACGIRLLYLQDAEELGIANKLGK